MRYLSMRLSPIIAVACISFMALDGAAAELKRIIQTEAGDGGLVVLVEPAEADLAVELARGGGHLVVALHRDARRVRALDEAFIEAGVHPAADAVLWHQPETLPFRDNAVNVLVIDPAATPGIDRDEVRRVIAPGYGLGLVSEGDNWRQVRKDRPEGMDTWLGWYRCGGGHVGSRDTLVQPPNSAQFLVGPRTVRGNILMTEQVLLHNYIARDAFTGTLRWAGDLPRRSGARAPEQFSNISDGRHLLGIQHAADGVMPVLDILTGEPIHEGVDLGATNFTQREGFARISHHQICTDGQRVYWADGARTVRAADIAGSRRLWEKQFDDPIELIATDGDIVAVLLVEDLEYAGEGIRINYNIATQIVGLDPATGQVQWRSDAFKGARTQLLAVGFGAVVASSQLVGPNPEPLEATRPGGLWDNVRRLKRELYDSNHMVALDGRTGQTLFSRTDFADIETVYGRPTLALLPDPQRIVVMDNERANRFDLRTGQTIGRPINTHTGTRTHTASVKWLFPPWGGISAEDGALPPHPHARLIHRAHYGSRVTPANGMYHDMPYAAAICGERYVGTSAAMVVRQPSPPIRDDRRLLVTGTARGIAEPDAADWPTFRGNFVRTAWTDSDGPAQPELLWQTRLPIATGPDVAQRIQRAWRFNSELPGPITQPVADGRRILVAVPDAHRLDCLGLADGELLWSTHLGGRIDAPPTLAGQVAFVGCNDGTVSAIDIEDGSVIWTFMAARHGDLIMAFDQVEGVGKVPSSPVLLDGTLFVAAGRHTHLEDGIMLWALDPATGAVKNRERLDERLGRWDVREVTPQPAQRRGHYDLTISPGAAHRHINDTMQVVDGELRLARSRIDPRTLQVRPDAREHGFDRYAPIPLSGLAHPGGLGWIRPTDQWAGYRHPIQWGPHFRDVNRHHAGTIVRSDGTLVVRYQAGRGVQGGVVTARDALDVVDPDDQSREIALPGEHALLQAVAGAGDRVYMAGVSGRVLSLMVADIASGEVTLTEVPAVIPSEHGIVPDGIPYSTRTDVSRFQNPPTDPDHERIIPDGIALAHGHIIVTTTAGRVLVFKGVE